MSFTEIIGGAIMGIILIFLNLLYLAAGIGFTWICLRAFLNLLYTIF